MTMTQTRVAGMVLTLLVVGYLITTGAAVSLDDGDETDEVQPYIVELDDTGLDTGEITGLGADIVYEYDIIDGLAIRATPTTASSVRSLSSVGSVVPDIPMLLPVMDGDGDDTQRDHHNATGVVAVLDTGIDDDHVDLDQTVISNEDVRDESSDPEDHHGHGTHVSSIIAGSGEGDEQYRGVAPDARLRNYKVLGTSGRGDMSTVIEGIDRAVEDSDVIVLSLGAKVDECDGTSPVSEAVNNAAAQGVAVVVAAGNEGPDGRTITAPGCAEDAFTVGATRTREQVADYSSRGPTADGRVKPDLVAPGTNIMAAEAGTSSGYTSKSGTSMAAPYAAAAVTVLMGTEEGEPHTSYIGALEDTTDDLGAGENSQGHGLIDIDAAQDSMDGDDGPDSDDGSGGQDGTDDTGETGDSTRDDDGGPGLLGRIIDLLRSVLGAIT